MVHLMGAELSVCESAGEIGNRNLCSIHEIVPRWGGGLRPSSQLRSIPTASTLAPPIVTVVFLFQSWIVSVERSPPQQPPPKETDVAVALARGVLEGAFLGHGPSKCPSKFLRLL